jgi:transposase-like protein
MSSSEFCLRLATEPIVYATLEEIARAGARRALQKAVEDEVEEYLAAHQDRLDESGRRLVVRNGRKAARTILTGVGPLEVRQPRVNDRRVDENGVRFRFTSKILPPYLGLKDRGLTDLPKLATGDGSLGFWLAMDKVFPSTKQQRCWVHKTANVLDKLPKSQQPAAKTMLHDIWQAATRAEAIKAFDRFIQTYESKWPRATDCLEKDRAELLAFHDFPAEHWRHLRTSNPIESTFATVRPRTYRTKGPGSRDAALAMAFKLAHKAQSGWRKLNGSEKLKDLIDGVVFVDGERKAA